MGRIALLLSFIILFSSLAAPAKADGIVAPDDFLYGPATGSLAAPEDSLSQASLRYNFAIDTDNPFADMAAEQVRTPQRDSAVPAKTAATTLPAPPATIFLVLQGMLCVAIVRGRRKWIAVIVAAVTIGRAGISMLPRLMQPNGQESAITNVPGEKAVLHAQRSASDAHAPDVSFLGLLRKINAEPPARNRIDSILSNNSHEPAAGLPFARPTAGFAVPAEPAHTHNEIQSAFAPLPCRGATPVEDYFPFVYARPPPG